MPDCDKCKFLELVDWSPKGENKLNPEITYTEKYCKLKKKCLCFLPDKEKFDSNRRQFVDEKDALDAKEAIKRFKEWINKNVSGTPVFISDNNGFDWMFVCWYFWHFLGENPFGYNSQNLNSINRGLNRDLDINLDLLRGRNLTHDALEDARDNAKIFRELRKKISQ